MIGQRSFLRLAFVLWALNGLLPVLAMLHRSLTPDDSLGLSAYAGLFMSSRTWELLGSTFLVAAATTVLTGVIGLPLSILFARTDLPARKTLLLLFALPFLLPPVVMAYGWFAAVGRDGWVAGFLGGWWSDRLFGPFGFVLVLTASCVPIVLAFTVASLLSASPRLEEAGLLCASPFRVLWGVTIPRLMPAFVAALLLVFCLAVGETGVPTFLRFHVYGVESLTQFAAFHDFATATAAAVPLVGATLLAFWGLRRLASLPGAALQATAAGTIPPLLRFGRRGPLIATGIALVWVALAGAPLAALIARSMDPSAWTEAIARTGESFGRSVLYAAAGASVVVLFGFLLGYGRARGLLGPASEVLPLFLFALPGPVLGIGLTSLWNRPATEGIYGTPWILILGLSAQYALLAVWITTASVGLIPRVVEEAAAVAGAHWTRRLAIITAPLAWKGLSAAWLLTFVFCLRDTGLAMAVYPPGHDTVTVRLFTLMANGRPEMISAVCVLILVGTTIPFAVAGHLLSRGRR